MTEGGQAQPPPDAFSQPATTPSSAPVPPAPPAPAYTPPAVEVASAGFRGLRGLSTWLQIAFWAFVATAVVGLVANVLEYRLYSEHEPAGFIPENVDTTLVDVLLVIYGVFYTLLWITLVVLFIIWIYRAYANVVPLGAREPRFGKGWAIGGWFVPIMNLWRPKQIVNDAWRASDRDAPADQGTAWRESEIPQFLTIWWIVFLITSWVANVTSRVVWTADDLPELKNAAVLSGVSGVFDIVGSILAIVVVRRLTARQEERAARLRAAGTLAA